LVINGPELDCSTHERNAHWTSDNLNWYFIKNDQPRFKIYMQIALAINEEMEDLEAGGIQAIQINKAALREILSLCKVEHTYYLDWVAHGFHITNCNMQDTTQIHTHKCYSNSNDIIHLIINHGYQ
jgi:5-methyltetrahydropteroyltriglutamate--homocysteine methyltransferase